MFGLMLLEVYLCRAGWRFVHWWAGRIRIVHRRRHGVHVVLLTVWVVRTDRCRLGVIVVVVDPVAGSARDKELGQC